MVLFEIDGAGVRMAMDPICGMVVDPSKTLFESLYQGRKVYFCCAGCKRTFDKDPAAHKPQPETG
jgi:Cu+-exporting ATPase